jgi:hypothetical protein
MPVLNPRAPFLASGRSGFSSACWSSSSSWWRCVKTAREMATAPSYGTAPANQGNRSLLRGRAFPLAPVRGVDPNKAGQPGCSVLLRERQDGPWMLFPAAITETAVIWEGGVSGVRYGTDSPTGDGDDTPNAMLQSDGSLALR